jgi:hypothetical protein
MTDRPQPAAEPSLKDAMRRLRIEEAERTGVIIALRDAELARLEILHDRLKPVFAQVPEGVDLFDIGVTPGETPRLWIDMIAFVEMGRDKRTFRFLQDTRHGRRVMVESSDTGLVADRVTAYIAQRLIERERMLALPPALPRAVLPAALGGPDEPAPVPAPASGTSETIRQEVDAQQADAQQAAAFSPPAPAERGGVRFSGVGALVIFLLGLAAGIGGVLGLAQFATRL